MSTANTRPRFTRGTRHARARSLLADLTIAVLAFFVLVCVAMLVPPLWAVVGGSTQPKFPLCDAIKNPLERLACKDTMNDGLAQPPKGANAPFASDAQRPDRAKSP